jgi:hypothetical protein
MRKPAAIGLALMLMTGCSTSEPAVVGATALQTAPPTTEPPPTTPPPPPSTLPSTTIPVTTTLPAGTGSTSLKSEDELKIEYVIGEFKKRDWNEQVNRTFDIKVYDGLIEGKQLANTQRALAKRKASSEYVLPGTIQEAVVVETSIESNMAKAIACQRNDQQVWEGNRTPDKSDDKLIDGSLAVFRISYELTKRGDSWNITNSTPSEGDCSSSF